MYTADLPVKHDLPIRTRGDIRRVSLPNVNIPNIKIYRLQTFVNKQAAIFLKPLLRRPRSYPTLIVRISMSSEFLKSVTSLR